MADLPKISIVTPSFNQAKYIERTIKSVLQQNYPNLEYTILDGGSIDGSQQVIECYAQQLAYWHSRPDKGQGDAIWQGIQKSTGEVFAWLNSDDIYLPGTLDFVGRYFAQHPDCKILAGNCLRIGTNGEIISKVFCAPNQTIRSMVFWGCFCLQPAVFWRRDLLLEAGPINQDLVVTFDTEFAIRYTKLARWHKVERFLACIRIHDEAKTSRLKDLATRERAKFLRCYGYYEINIIIRLILRLFYRGRYEVKRVLVSIFRPQWRAKMPVWGSDPCNADPI
jgi:glycosyltransferase involved in cell wall biosynthesis